MLKMITLADYVHFYLSYQTFLTIEMKNINLYIIIIFTYFGFNMH